MRLQAESSELCRAVSGLAQPAVSGGHKSGLTERVALSRKGLSFRSRPANGAQQVVLVPAHRTERRPGLVDNVPVTAMTARLTP